MMGVLGLARPGQSFHGEHFLMRGRPGGGPLNRWVLKSCEPGLHDQSVLNWLFERAWYRLPRVYNAQPRLWDMLECSNMRNGSAQVALLHFAGRAKPWWQNPMEVPQPIVPLSKSAIKVWRRQCPHVPLERGIRGKTRGARRPQPCERWAGVWKEAVYG
jgi:hypothetical protein